MAEQKVQPFLFEGQILVRVVERNTAPWFVAKDVADALGYKNSRLAVRTHCKHSCPAGGSETLPPGLDPQTVLIPEGDVYRLIMRSKMPSAERFERWVMDDVLPSIRRTGTYTVTEQPAQPPAALAPRPFDEWSLEERRTNLALVNGARHTFNQASAAWMWERVGLPVPPRHLLPAWWQAELNLGAPGGRALTITVPIGCERN